MSITYLVKLADADVLVTADDFELDIDSDAPTTAFYNFYEASGKDEDITVAAFPFAAVKYICRK